MPQNGEESVLEEPAESAQTHLFRNSIEWGKGGINAKTKWLGGKTEQTVVQTSWTDPTFKHSATPTNRLVHPQEVGLVVQRHDHDVIQKTYSQRGIERVLESRSQLAIRTTWQKTKWNPCRWNGIRQNYIDYCYVDITCTPPRHLGASLDCGAY